MLALYKQPFSFIQGNTRTNYTMSSHPDFRITDKHNFDAVLATFRFQEDKDDIKGALKL